MKKLLMFIATMCFITVVYGQPQTNLIGFQNIPWGSDIGVVKNKLFNSKIIDECKGRSAEYKQLYKKYNKGCHSVVLDSYMINGLEMKLKASFNFSNKLQRVVLSKTYSEGDFMKECGVANAQLNHLLETRYGSSNYANTDDVIYPYKNQEIKVWLPLPTEIWIAKAYGLLDDEKKFQDERCEVRIQYSKRQPDEASKL